MTTVLSVLGVLALALLAFCYVELARRPAKALPKALWAVIIVASIPLGAILYLVLGRGDQVAPTPVAPAVPADPAPADPAPRPAIAPAGPAITTRGLTKAFRDQVALSGVDLIVPARGVYGLVGPNGAGKTTLMSILAGLRRPTSGSVDATGRVMLCPDAPAFEPWLTAMETVQLFGSSDPERDLATVGLAPARHRRVGGFSRGMTQRLGLAVALASGADVLMLDEPTSALDPQGRAEILHLIASLGQHRAVLVSSHVLADIQRVADTVAVLRAGHLIYQGPVPELIERHTRPGWRIELRSGAPELVARLAPLPWVTAVSTEAGSVRVDTTTTSAAPLLAQLEASGAELIALNPVGADLESVFLSVVEQ